MVRIKQLGYQTYLILSFTIFLAPLYSSGQIPIDITELRDCDVKKILFDDEKSFSIDYLFAADSILKDQEKLNSPLVTFNYTDSFQLQIPTALYQLNNNSTISIGAIDSFLFVEIADTQLLLKFTEKITSQLLGYKREMNYIQPFFSLKTNNCNLFLSILYDMESDRIRITQYDNEPMNLKE